MAQDMYYRQPLSLGGVFTSDKSLITISGSTGDMVGALVQGLQANYSQAYSEVYEIGSNNVYRVIGRPAGRMSIDRIVAIQSSMVTGEEEALFNACKGGATITINPSGGTNCFAGEGSQLSGNAGLKLTFKGCFVINYGVSIGVADLLIREGLQLAFTSLERESA